jgi:hypothetical protein
MLDALKAGVRVRHRKQSDWGVGVVASARRAGDSVDVVIDFAAGGQRKLRLRDLSLVEVLPAAEVQALEQAQRDAETARKKALRGEKVAPFATVTTGEYGLQGLLAVDGCLVINDARLRWFDADARPLGELAFEKGHRPDGLEDGGQGLIIGTSLDAKGLVFARRGEAAPRQWRPSEELLAKKEACVFAPAGGRGALVRYRTWLGIAHENGTTREVAFDRRGRELSGACWWNGELLVETSRTSAQGTVAGPSFQFACLTLDGAVKFGGEAHSPTPITDDTMMVLAPFPVGYDRGGAMVGRYDAQAKAMGTFDGDAVLEVVADGKWHLARWSPRSTTPRWQTPLPVKLPLGLATRVGRFIAVTTTPNLETAQPVVWILDAESGAIVHELPVRERATSLVAFGDDALAAGTLSRSTPAWRGIGGKLTRFELPTEKDCTELLSPAPGVLIAFAWTTLSFFRL